MPGSLETSSPRLTARERMVVAHVVEGLRDDEIAAALHLSTRTVQAHVSSAMRKLALRSRTQLAVHALRTGLVPLHPDGDGAGI